MEHFGPGCGRLRRKRCNPGGGTKVCMVCKYLFLVRVLWYYLKLVPYYTHNLNYLIK